MKHQLVEKRVFITGINGFIGQALSKKLEKAGAIVFGLSHTLPESKKILHSTISNFNNMNEFIKKNKIEIIFHLAGESIVESGQSNPYQTFQTNNQGTLNILELARVNNMSKIIIASSSHVYGKNKLPYYEGYQARPSRPYETSKAVSDLIAQSYADTFNLPVLIPRFVNVYGPGDTNFTRLIPKTIKSVLENREPDMWGGSAVREYLYIDDAVNAYILLAGIDMKKVGKNRIFNFGSGQTISVRELIGTIISLSGKDLKINKIEDIREQEISMQYVSSKKAKKILGWESKYNLENGLIKTLAWYKQHMQRTT